MLKLIHITDTHFVESDTLLYGRDPRNGLNQCILDIMEHHRDAQMCFVTGDLTHEGKVQAYEELVKSLTKLPMPVQLILGNHDNRSIFREHFPQTPIDPNGFIQYTVDLGHYTGIFLDSNEPAVSYGVFCEKRGSWLREQLERSTKPVILFMHHPPFALGIPVMDRIALLEAEHFNNAIAGYETKIRHFFFGHIHRPITGNWRGISFSTLRGTNHQVALTLYDTKKVVGCYEPAQYGVVLLDEQQITVHYNDFQDRGDRFWL